jgi:hypothetical protein
MKVELQGIDTERQVCDLPLRPSYAEVGKHLQQPDSL